MKKITLITLTMFFFIQAVEQEERQPEKQFQEQFTDEQREIEGTRQNEEEQERIQLEQEERRGIPEPRENEEAPQEQPLLQKEQERMQPEQEERRMPQEQEERQPEEQFTDEQREIEGTRQNEEEQERMQLEQEERRMPQEQEERQPEQTEERLPTEAVPNAKALETFFALFPDPNKPEFQLAPNLNGVITLVYEETLGVPPLVFAGIKRLYALMQSLTFQEQNINFQDLPERDKVELNNQILARCKDSSMWQNYNKTFIAESLEYGMSLLKSVHQEEKMIFTYIPNFETAYYSKGYTDVRNGAELVRLSLVLSDGMRERAISQCNWRELKSVDQLYEEIEQYKEGEFYRLTKQIQTLLKSNQRYPFPQDAQIIDHNGNVAPAFNHFIYKEENGRLTVSEYAQFIMNVDKKNQPYLTAFGNFVFSYNSNESGPYLSKNPIFHKLFSETEQGIMPQPAFLEMLALDGIKFLNAHLAYLFNAENLESTMQKLVRLEQKDQEILQQFPNILPYVPTDYPYLAGIKELLPLLAEDPHPHASVQSWDSFWHSVGHAFTSAADAIAHTAESAWTTIKHAGEKFGSDLLHGIEDFGKGVGYFFAATAMAIADPSKGASFFQRSFSNFSNMGHDLGNAITQVGNVVKASVSVATSIAGQTIGAIMQDQQLGDNLAGLVNSLADGIVNAVGDLSNYFIEGALDVYRLSAEALLVCEAGFMALITGGTHGYGSAFEKDGNYFAKDIVVSILTELTFLTKAIGAILTAVMKGIAYLCSAIIDLIGDVFGDLAALFMDMTGGKKVWGRSGLSVLGQIKAGVHKWRRTIIGSIMLVGGIALTVGSLGTLGPIGITMAVAGTGMMVIGTMGDVQQDLAAHKKKKVQDAILAKYSAGVPGQAISAQALESSAMAEATVQFAAEKQNSERGLVYYQNFLNSQFNNAISTQSTALGNFYKELTMPDPQTGVPFSDPGHLYGIKTERIALNPAGGLYSFNAERNTFAQETATTPKQTVKTTQNALFTISPTTTGLWINQRDLSNVWGTGSLEVEIRFRTIYETEGNFYVGVFMSEQVMNIPLLQALNKNYEDALKLSGKNAAAYVDKTWENLDTFNRNLLNYNTLSRNFVIFRENGSSPTLGFYQHEGAGDGWLNKNIGGVTYQRGVWYRMKMAISGTTTRVKCWEEAAGETNEWVTFNTPQAKRLPIIKPIQLPNDTDPFELIVKKPAPIRKKPATERREPTKESPREISSSTNDWTVSAAPQEGPETKPWEIIRPPEEGPQTHEWQVKEVIDIQPRTVAWTVSGKAQQTESENIDQAYGSIGMISSGASVEYQILSPTTKLKVMPARKKQNENVASSFKQQGIMLDEQDREREWLLKHGTAEPQMQGATNQTPNNNYQNPQEPTEQSPNPQQRGSQNSYQNPEQPTDQPPNSQWRRPQQQSERRPEQPTKPAHSTFWYLQHGQTPPSQKNINSKISTDGKFAIMGGPS